MATSFAHISLLIFVCFITELCACYKLSRFVARDRAVAVSSVLELDKELFFERVQTVDDLRIAADFCIQTFYGDSSNFLKYGALQILAKTQYDDLIQRFSLDNDAAFKVCHKDGKMVGFAEVFLWDLNLKNLRYYAGDTTLNLEERKLYPKIANLAVDESVRRKGVGTKLLDSCISQARKWGYDEVVLLVDEDNEGALNFYKNLGFKKIGIYPTIKRYEWSGFYLYLKKVPKYLLYKKMPNSNSEILQ